MAKLTKIQTDFLWGELSPRLFARVDLAAYGKSVKTMTNYYPFIHGGVTRRPGTTYIGELYNSNQKAKLIPFVYSRTSAFMLIFNGGKVEFVKDGAFIETAPGTTYKLTSPYAEADLDQLAYAQAGNILFLTHPSYPPKQLQRLSDTSWTLTNIPFTYRASQDAWFENFSISFKILSGSVAFAAGDVFTATVNGSGVVTGTTTTFVTRTPACNGSIFATTATGRGPAETWTITCSYVEGTRAYFTVVGSVSGSPCATWAASDYPRAVSFYEQRLFFAGSPTHPQTIWGSSIDDQNDFTLGANDKDGLSFTIASNSFDQIVHLASGRRLLPLTYSTEFTMTGGVSGITPSQVKIQPQTFHGTNDVRPILIGERAVFTQKDGKKLRAIKYSLTEDANTAPDITLFAEHITGTNNGIVDMTFAQDPDYIAWIIRDDGVMLSLTYETIQDTTGWAKHTTDGLFEKVCAVPSANSTDVYAIVKRTIGGVVTRFIERFDYGTYRVDCGLAKTSVSPTTSWAGYDHLAGKTVAVVADGVTHPDVVVSAGGVITTQYAASAITAGLGFTSTLELLHPEMGDATSSTQGRTIAIDTLIIRFKDTINCRVDVGVGNYEYPFRTTGDLLDTPIAAFTGDKRITATGWRSPNNLKIEQITPMPSTILGCIMKTSVNE